MNNTYEEQYLNSIYYLSERSPKKQKINYCDDFDDEIDNVENIKINDKINSKILLNHSDVFESTKATITKLNNIYELKYKISFHSDEKFINTKFNNILPYKRFIVLFIETNNHYIKIILPEILKKLKINQIIKYSVENNKLKIYFTYNEILFPKLIKNTCLIHNSMSNSKVILNLNELKNNIKFVDITNGKILIKYNLSNNLIINMFLTLPKIINIDNFNKYEIIGKKFIMYFNN